LRWRKAKVATTSGWTQFDFGVLMRGGGCGGSVRFNRAKFVRERRKKPAFQMVENRRDVSHKKQTRRTPFRSNNPEIIPSKPGF
jgi:hypothetical protein